MKFLLFFLLAALAGSGLPASAQTPRTVPAQAIEATPADGGAPVRPLGSGQGKTATVLLFIAHDCPISNAYAPEVARLYRQFAARGVRFYLVYAEALAPEEARAHVRAFGYPCRALLDARRFLVRFTGATVTPEAFVYTRRVGLVYRGRINDLYAALGQKRAVARHNELRDALQAVVRGQKPSVARTTSVGCFIP